MRSIGARSLLLVSILVLSGCGPSGGMVNVRKPFPGKAPNLLLGLPTSIQAEQKLSDELLDSADPSTPTTNSPTND